jgi:hypothetical protein
MARFTILAASISSREGANAQQSAQPRIGILVPPVPALFEIPLLEGDSALAESNRL